MNLDTRETATVLAALRHWQKEGWVVVTVDGDSSSMDTLGASEVDDLCERINCDSPDLWHLGKLPGDEDGRAIRDENGLLVGHARTVIDAAKIVAAHNGEGDE